MRDRLIELILECQTFTPEYAKQARLHAEYVTQHLLNNDVIVLPCKLNRRVYDISEFVDEHPCPDVYEFLADEIIISKCRKTKEFIFSIDGMDYTFDEFGKVVFSTREEAERAIAERSKR